VLVAGDVGDPFMSPAAASSPTIRLRNVTLGYDSHPAVHHLDGEIAPGSLTAVIGPNGSGKSTLIKGIVGQLAPLEGRIEILGGARDAIAYLPQQAAIDRTFPISVADLVALGLWSEIGSLRGLATQQRTRVAEALSAVGLQGLGRRPIDTLSGGQLQRALFARVLLQDSRLILLDEPFTAIDAKTSAALMALIERWHGEARTIVAVLHDIELVKERFPRALMLAREPVAWGETREVLTAANLLKARAMSEHWMEDAPWCKRGAAV
jgi:zinc/manganese transport system ATP-binding protein